MKRKCSIMLGEKAYKQMRKEIQTHWNQCIGQSIAELALELEESDEIAFHKKIVQTRIETETWEKLKLKAAKEGTSISRLFERVLWERAELE